MPPIYSIYRDSIPIDDNSIHCRIMGNNRIPWLPPVPSSVVVDIIPRDTNLWLTIAVYIPPVIENTNRRGVNRKPVRRVSTRKELPRRVKVGNTELVKHPRRKCVREREGQLARSRPVLIRRHRRVKIIPIPGIPLLPITYVRKPVFEVRRQVLLKLYRPGKLINPLLRDVKYTEEIILLILQTPRCIYRIGRKATISVFPIILEIGILTVGRKGGKIGNPLIPGKPYTEHWEKMACHRLRTR